MQVRCRILDVILFRSCLARLLDLGNEGVSPGRCEHGQPGVLEQDDVVFYGFVVERLDLVRVNEQCGVVIEPALGKSELFGDGLGCFL